MSRTPVEVVARIIGLIGGTIAIIVVILLAGFFAGGLLLWLGWNYGMVPAFGLAKIAYLPACWIEVMILTIGSAFQVNIKKNRS